MILRLRQKGLRNLLRDWNDFAAKTEFGFVLEFFCRIEVGLRLFLSEEKRRGIGLRKFLSKKAKIRKVVGLEIICPKKKGEGEKVMQVRRGVRSPVR